MKCQVCGYEGPDVARRRGEAARVWAGLTKTQQATMVAGRGPLPTRQALQNRGLVTRARGSLLLNLTDLGRRVAEYGRTEWSVGPRDDVDVEIGGAL